MGLDKTFKVGGVAAIDATSITSTGAFTIDNLNDYSITFVKTGTDGNPIIEVQGSNDGTNWVNPYLESDGVTEVTMELDATSNSVRDRLTFGFKHIKVYTIPNGTTTGTISMIMRHKI